MKKVLCVLLSAVILSAMLCGCSEVDVLPTSDTTFSDTDPADNESGTTEHKGIITGIPMPENPGNNLVEYDPDREVYILLENMDVTNFGAGQAYGFVITIMSKHVLDPAEMEINIPCKNAYETAGFTMSEHNYRNTEYGYGTTDAYLPFYVYQNYLGVDFSLAGKLYGWYMNPPEEGSQAAEEMKTLTGGRNPKTVFDELINTGLEEFAALKPEDTREFYIYTATVKFTVTVEETISALDVIIGGENYHQEIGSLRLVPESFPSAYPVNEEYPWTGYSIPFGYGGVTLYGDGLYEAFIFEATTTEDLTLESFRIFEDSFEIKDIIVCVTSNGVAMEVGWDGVSPITLYEGDTVSIAAVIRNEKLASFMFRLGMNYELVYSIDGEMFSQCSSTFIEPAVNYHEIYAIVFDGVNMESYYRDYYYPIYQQWQNEYQ